MKFLLCFALIICGTLSLTFDFNNQLNVNGNDLELCSNNPKTGFFRDGYCRTNQQDRGTHTVCAEMTEEFLSFTKSKGNDLSTARQHFPGLKPGDHWCLCALRWKEALNAGKAPKVVLGATNNHTLEYVPLDDLQNHAVVKSKDL